MRPNYSNSQQLVPLRKQAIEALQESTTMLEVACGLMEQGNKKEAERLHRAARTKRSVSVLLMAKANEMETDARKRYPVFVDDDDSSMAH